MPELSTFTTPPLFWIPDRLSEPNPWIGHIPFAFWLIDSLKPRMIVELGTHSGNSYLAFCQAVQQLQLETSCRAIDTWKGDSQAGFYGEEVYVDLACYHDEKYGSFSRLIRSTFEEAVDSFADGTIDLLHIDGWHTYEAVKRDFQTWLVKLSDGAIVLFHDIEVREGDFGVWQLWEELTAQYPHFSFSHSYGLGVLGIGKDIPAPLHQLFSLEKEPFLREQVKGLCARLGCFLVEKQTNQRLQEEIKGLSGQVEQLKEQLYQVHEQWQDCQAYSRQIRSEIEGVIARLEQSQTQLHQASEGWEQSQTQLHQAQEGWEKAQETIQWMESSKFWQLRELWLEKKPF